jgi:hypothetical protein
MVRNPKLDGPISQEAATAPGRRHEQEALKDGPSADQPESSQGRTGPRSKSSANGKAKPDTEKCPEEVVAEQNRIPEVKAETIAEAGSSSRQPPNWIVRFPKPDHSVSSGPGQRGTSRTTTPKIAPPFRLCPPGLTSSQRKRIQ